MAQLGRSDITTEMQTKLPTNNVKFITALLLREFEEIMNESFFNLVDDDLSNIFLSTGENAETAVNNLSTRAGATRSGSAFVTSVPNASFPVTGDCTHATYDSGDAEIVITFTPYTSTNYVVEAYLIDNGSQSVIDDIDIVDNETFTVKSSSFNNTQKTLAFYIKAIN